MKKALVILLILFSTVFIEANAQCSICTKTASQLGVKPAKGLNSAIIYLMLTPFLIGGVIGYRWWKSNQAEE
ncbi:MAG: hypothetical protein HYR66_09055 [Sphingobacteriales bacterium]|nr:hypothetical protein [Sphingobacteriales bacterium]MBI3720328.1 hypothetical protein [Sphingobacteriales bacterium]